MTYFLTCTCYGVHLHGDESGSVDRRHNLLGVLESNPDRIIRERRAMKDQPYEMDANRRKIVLKTFLEVCAYRGWKLLAAHIRRNHIHAIIDAEARPEKVMNDLKAYASRALN